MHGMPDVRVSCLRAPHRQLLFQQQHYQLYIYIYVYNIYILSKYQSRLGSFAAWCLRVPYTPLTQVCFPFVPSPFLFCAPEMPHVDRSASRPSVRERPRARPERRLRPSYRRRQVSCTCAVARWGFGAHADADADADAVELPPVRVDGRLPSPSLRFASPCRHL